MQDYELIYGDCLDLMAGMPDDCVDFDYRPTSYDSTDRYPRDVLKGPTDKQKSCLHPTQKPVWLCEQLILTYTNAGDTVLDCCMGSGSIGVACLKNRRKYIGMENNKDIFEIARKRLEVLRDG